MSGRLPDGPSDVDLLRSRRDLVDYLLADEPVIQDNIATFQKLHCPHCNELGVARASSADKHLPLFHNLLFHSSTALRQPSAIAIAPCLTSRSATFAPSFSGSFALPTFFALILRVPSAEKTLA